MPSSDSDRWHPGQILAFLGIGAVLYLALLFWSERLAMANGARNPFFQIERAAQQQDWIILGASHAMPLAFDGAEAQIEAATGQTILNLAATGSGPFVWRLVAERYFRDHAAANVLIVADGFAFRDRRWNQDRIGDSDFLPRVPWDIATLRVMAAAVPRGLRPTTLANYATGFSKIGNPDRFKPDIWETEARFDLSPRPSAASDKARVAYLYPGPPDPAAEAAYFNDLGALADLARRNGARVTVIRPPLPDRFRALLPDDAAFAARLSAFAAAQGVGYADMAGVLPEPRFYLDPDHLNRAGVEAWLNAELGALLRDR